MTRQTPAHDRGIAPGEHARMSLALWLRQGRASRGMSLEAVAKVTKIQARILERLETGRFDGLPADVFVRGFVRSFARCVGLDEAEALSRYVACGRGDAAGTSAGATARAFVETMSDLAPAAARSAAGPRILRDAADIADKAGSASAPAIEIVDSVSGPRADEWRRDSVTIDASSDAAVELDSARLAEGSARLDVMPALAAGTSESEIVDAANVADTASEADVAAVTPAVEPPAKKKRMRKPKATAVPGERDASVAAAGRKRKKAATLLAPIVVEVPVELGTIVEVDARQAPSEVVLSAPIFVEDLPGSGTITEDAPAIEDAAVAGLWTPRMPVAQPSAPWRRPAFAAQVSPAAPSIVIDDADPDSAERELEERRDVGTRTLRSFLPPILLDREDRSARQGGLTLAVIILLIAATLTLSYLMRRPGSSGDGMTARDVPTQLVG